MCKAANVAVRPAAVLRTRILTGCLVSHCRLQAFSEVILTVIFVLKRNPSVTSFYLNLNTKKAGHQLKAQALFMKTLLP